MMAPIAMAAPIAVPITVIVATVAITTPVAIPVTVIVAAVRRVAADLAERTCQSLAAALGLLRALHWLRRLNLLDLLDIAIAADNALNRLAVSIGPADSLNPLHAGIAAIGALDLLNAIDAGLPVAIIATLDPGRALAVRPLGTLNRLRSRGAMVRTVVALARSCSMVAHAAQDGAVFSLGSRRHKHAGCHQ
jgi:hypothetical protein